MSANVDPSVVGGFLVVTAIGVFLLYIWLDHNKNSHYSSSYSTRREPKGYQVSGDYEDNNEEDDAYEAGYQNERGRQAALAEARRQRNNEIIRKRDRQFAQEYYDNTTLTNLSPPRGYDPFLGDSQSKKRRKKQWIWE